MMYKNVYTSNNIEFTDKYWDLRIFYTHFDSLVNSMTLKLRVCAEREDSWYVWGPIYSTTLLFPNRLFSKNIISK